MAISFYVQLSDRDKAIAHAFIKMLDENLYWVLVHAVWQLEQGCL